jgi:hypothetical protein
LLGDGSLDWAYKQPFLTEMPRRPRCLDGATNPGGEVTMATWFELPASHLDELTPGKYTPITVGAHTPTNRVNRKPSTFSCGEIQFRSVNSWSDAQMLSG